MDDHLNWEYHSGDDFGQQDIHSLGNVQATFAQDQSVIAHPTHSGTEEEEDISVSVSTIFHPGSGAVSITPDCVLSASDGIFFYINSHLLFHVGARAFPLTPLQRSGGMIPAGPVTSVPENSVVLTIIFCAVYNISCDPIAPSLDDIFSAIDRMSPNGLPPQALVRRGAPLYGLIMTNHAPYQPLKVYSLAAHYDLESLAQDTSSHLLNLDLNHIDEASAIGMGPLYFKRLALLISSRIKFLKTIIGEPPVSHVLVRGCSEEIQKAARKEWVHTVTHLMWEVKPGISPSLVKETFRLAAQALPCKVCHRNWCDRADDISSQWARAEHTI